MILSHVKKFIYLKTIKTGSSSVESYFEPYCGPTYLHDPTLIHDHSFNNFGIIISRYCTKLTKKKGWHTHMPAPMLKEMLSEMDKQCRNSWDSYFKFVVVRNPYQRAVSWFYFNERNRDLDICVDEYQYKFEKYTKSLFMSDWHIYSIDDIPCMDYYIRHEDMDKGMQDVCNHLNVPWKPKKMPMHLSGLRKGIHPSLLFNDTTRQYVAELCHREIDYFGYKFPF